MEPESEQWKEPEWTTGPTGWTTPFAGPFHSLGSRFSISVFDLISVHPPMLHRHPACARPPSAARPAARRGLHGGGPAAAPEDHVPGRHRPAESHAGARAAARRPLRGGGAHQAVLPRSRPAVAPGRGGALARQLRGVVPRRPAAASRRRRCAARLRIDPVGEQYFLGDRRFRRFDRTALRLGGRDPVYPPSSDSLMLRDAVVPPRSRAGGRADARPVHRLGHASAAASGRRTVGDRRRHQSTRRRAGALQRASSTASTTSTSGSATATRRCAARSSI